MTRRLVSNLIALAFVPFALMSAQAQRVSTPAASATPMPSAASASSEAVQMATAVGFSMGALPELQRRCNHTADQKRRVARVTGYLEQQLIAGGGQALGAAFRKGQETAASQTVGFTAKLSASELTSACAKMNSDFDEKLKGAEANIPATFMPATRVIPAKPASATTPASAPLKR